MKKILVVFLMLMGIPAFADEVQLGGIETQKIELPKADVNKKQSLVVNDEQALQ